MARYESTSLRNIAVAGHGGTGKTTVCEALLYGAGRTDRLGRVDEGTSPLDFEPQEQRRHISISAAANYIEWDKHKITLLDTPGDANFAYDTRSCMRVADGALIVVDAVGGVEFQTEKVWEYADAFSLSRIIFVNRMDRERADFARVLDSVKIKLGAKATPLVLPLGAEDSFRGVVDLIEMKALVFDDARGGFHAEDIPADLQEAAASLRETMVEDIAESDEELMEKYLNEGDLTLEELKAGLRKGVIAGGIVPALCGAALKNVGVMPLLDLIVGCMPSPADRGPVKGIKPGTENEEMRSPEESAPFSALVFKTIADPYTGRLTMFRVYSGTLAPDASFYNASRRTTERFGNIFFLEGKSQKPVDAPLVPGDIAAVAKLKDTYTGDTLCPEKAQIVYPRLQPAHAIMAYAIEPRSRGDEEKIVSSITRLTEEDLALNFRRDDQTKEMILAGMGQVHIEATVEKMRRKFGVEVNLRLPKVPYKETIKGKTNIQGRYKKQSGGRGQFGDCWLDIEPLPRGGGFEFVDKIVGGVIPQQYRPAVEKGIVEAMEEGALAGYPIVDVKVSLVDGSYHTVDSSELAFKIAGSMGFKKGVLAAQPTLLEPIVNIEIEIPEEYMGDVIGDLNSRRGKVLGMDAKGSHRIVRGLVPFAEILKYAADLISMTSGRGTFTYEFSHYEEVPAYIAEKLIAEAKKDEDK
jgi:elongation factor G